MLTSVRFPHLLLAVVLLGAAFLTTFSTVSRADGIFDDDWSPPLRKEKAPEMPVEPPAKAPPPVEVPTDSPPEKTDKTPTKPPTSIAKPPADVEAPASTEPRPIPSKSALAASRRLLKEAYARELADRSAGARREIAQKLFDEAARSDNNPPDQFALLGGAIEAAREGGTIPVSFRAIDELSRKYNVDGLALKVDSIVKTSPAKGEPPTAVAENVRLGVALLDALCALDDYPAAVRVGAALQKFAQPSAPSRTLVALRVRKMNEVRAAYQRIAPQMEKLKAAPHDEEANLAVGKYLCFSKGQWDRGLPMLAAGSDKTLAALALKESTHPADAAAMVLIGDGWWDVADKESAGNSTQVRRHAARSYRLAQPELTGVVRTKVQKRLSELPPEESASTAN